MFKDMKTAENENLSALDNNTERVSKTSSSRSHNIKTSILKSCVCQLESVDLHNSESK